MADNPLDRIQTYLPDMTKTDKEIAYYILNNPMDSARTAIDGLAKSTKTSKAALVRFANKIGYSGFAEFRFALSRFLVSHNADDTETGEKEQTPIVSITGIYADFIRRIPETVTQEDVDYIARKIIGARRLKIYGIDRTYNSALQFRQRLGRIGYDGEAVNVTSTMADLQEILTKEDLLIVFTTRDNGHFYGDYVKSTAAAGCPVFVFTMTQGLPFKKYCDRYVVLPRISRNSTMSFLDDQAIYMVFIEVLMNAIATISGESK